MPTFFFRSHHISTKQDWHKKTAQVFALDEVASMVGWTKVFISSVQERKPDVIVMQGCLHCRSVISKSLLADLVTVSDDVVRKVNIVKTRLVKSHVFIFFVRKWVRMIKPYYSLHMPKWLSRGKVLPCVYELCEELEIFLTNKDRFHDVTCKWWIVCEAGIPLKYI